MPSEAFLKLLEALYGPLIDAISVGFELLSDSKFKEVARISVPVRRVEYMYSRKQTHTQYG